MQLVDTHCHLNFEPLVDDVGGVLRRAESCGVSRIVVPAYDLASWRAIETLSQMSGVFVALGLDAQAAQQRLQQPHVRQIRHVVQHRLPLDENRGRHDRKGRILGPTYLDGALQSSPTDNLEKVHGLSFPVGFHSYEAP